ncbi:MAG: hypothetical protein Q9218_003720 [Villophora microphyllina]
MSAMLSSLVFLLIVTAIADPSPQVVQFNNQKSIGPDGPWNVVTVGVGTDSSGNALSQVDLFPGGFTESIILNTEYCDAQSMDTCAASQGGLWDAQNSKTAMQNISDLPGNVWQWGSSAAIEQTGMAKEAVDTMFMNVSRGLIKVANASIVSTKADFFHLPSGQQWSLPAGTLSIGCRKGTRVFDNVTAITIPGYLAGQNITPSDSAGLHYGSASLGLGGSLTWGGYDRSRLLGDVGTFQFYDPGSLLIPNLVDVQIGVETGGSPFPNGETNFTNLLTLNKTLGGNVQPAIINPLLSYLFMSPTTCANIAAHLPITLQPQLGLYTWNTGDPQYTRIIASPAYLALVFQSGYPISSGNLTIKIPFALLNLTLEQPIVTTPTQYFPLQPFESLDGKGNYYLGRAFLQAAFVGVNWNHSVWYMGQAPGPGAEEADVRGIGATDGTISSSPISRFADSWRGHWTPLPETSGGANGTASMKASSSSDGDTKGVSKGAVAGITIGAIAAVVTILAALWFFVIRERRRKRKVDSELQDESNGLGPDGINRMHEKEASLGNRYEAAGNERFMHEARNDGSRIEVEGGKPPLPAKGAGLKGVRRHEVEGTKPVELGLASPKSKGELPEAN